LLRNWRPDGQRLATVPDEAELFDQVIQRKALQAELDEVRNARSRLRSLVAEWQTKGKPVTPAGQAATPGEEEDQPAFPLLALEKKVSRDESNRIAVAEINEVLARQNAHLLASKALVLRTHARLEEGHGAEVEIALLRVWLEKAAVSLEAFEGTVQHWLEVSGRHDDRPVVELTAGPPVTTYADYLAAPCPYDSGDFLRTP